MKTDVGAGALAVFLDARNPGVGRLECQEVGVDARVFAAFVEEVGRAEERAVLLTLGAVVGVAAAVDGDSFGSAGGLVEGLARDEGDC